MIKLPQITQNFIKEIEKNAKTGRYSVNTEGIEIEVFPYVFPPQSPFSESTHNAHSQLVNLKGKRILDIGTGTGILAIKAALAGAEDIEATDISTAAIDCAIHNTQKNLVDRKIQIYKSDIFSNVRGYFDLIFANLPILDYPEEDTRFHSLCDPKFKYHQRLFAEARNYLKPDGKMTLCHANLQADGFRKLEQLALKNGLEFKIKQEVKALDYNWRNYEFHKES